MHVNVKLTYVYYFNNKYTRWYPVIQNNKLRIIVKALNA